MLKSKDVCIIDGPIEIGERFLGNKIGKQWAGNRRDAGSGIPWEIFHYSAYYVIAGPGEKNTAIRQQWVEPSRKIKFGATYDEARLGISRDINSWRLAKVGIIHANFYRLVGLDWRIDDDELFRPNPRIADLPSSHPSALA
jgi:hypothetical protein